MDAARRLRLEESARRLKFVTWYGLAGAALGATCLMMFHAHTVALVIGSLCVVSGLGTVANVELLRKRIRRVLASADR